MGMELRIREAPKGRQRQGGLSAIKNKQAANMLIMQAADVEQKWSDKYSESEDLEMEI